MDDWDDYTETDIRRYQPGDDMQGLLFRGRALKGCVSVYSYHAYESIRSHVDESYVEGGGLAYAYLTLNGCESEAVAFFDRHAYLAVVRAYGILLKRGAEDRGDADD